MKSFAESIKKLYQSERLTLVLIILNLLASIALFIVGIIKLNPDSAIVKIGYGDIGGYRDGAWTDMFAFPVLALLFGILHGLIAVKIYHRRGAGMTKFFLITTSMLIVGAFIVLIRLLKEG